MSTQNEVLALLKEGLRELKGVDAVEGALIQRLIAVAEASDQQQEPYGWHTEDHLTDRSATTYSKDVADRWKSKGWPVTPLYTSPPASKPLTDEQISDLWDGHTVPVFGKTGINPIVFARAIEAAHGIKENE